MRNIILIIIAGTLSAPALAQAGANPPTDWPNAIERVESAMAAGDAERLGRLVSTLADSGLEPARWRDYWVAYAAYRHGLFLDDEDAAKQAYKRCTEAAEAAIARGERSGESEALRGACYSQLAGTGPMAGMRYGSRSGVAIETALTDAPDNPRVLTVAGASDVYTPAQWGGDLERAVRRLERALERFGEKDGEAGDEPWAPRWGRLDAHGHLATAYKRLEREDEARRVLARAEAAGLESRWLSSIRDGLETPDGG